MTSFITNYSRIILSQILVMLGLIALPASAQGPLGATQQDALYPIAVDILTYLKNRFDPGSVSLIGYAHSSSAGIPSSWDYVAFVYEITTDEDNISDEDGSRTYQLLVASNFDLTEQLHEPIIWSDFPSSPNAGQTELEFYPVLTDSLPFDDIVTSDKPNSYVGDGAYEWLTDPFGTDDLFTSFGGYYGPPPYYNDDNDTWVVPPQTPASTSECQPVWGNTYSSGNAHIVAQLIEDLPSGSPLTFELKDRIKADNNLFFDGLYFSGGFLNTKWKTLNKNGDLGGEQLYETYYPSVEAGKKIWCIPVEVDEPGKGRLHVFDFDGNDGVFQQSDEGQWYVTTYFVTWPVILPPEPELIPEYPLPIGYQLCALDGDWANLIEAAIADPAIEVHAGPLSVYEDLLAYEVTDAADHEKFAIAVDLLVGWLWGEDTYTVNACPEITVCVEHWEKVLSDLLELDQLPPWTFASNVSTPDGTIPCMNHPTAYGGTVWPVKIYNFGNGYDLAHQNAMGETLPGAPPDWTPEASDFQTLLDLFAVEWTWSGPAIQYGSLSKYVVADCVGPIQVAPSTFTLSSMIKDEKVDAFPLQLHHEHQQAVMITSIVPNPNPANTIKDIYMPPGGFNPSPPPATFTDALNVPQIINWEPTEDPIIYIGVYEAISLLLTNPPDVMPIWLEAINNSNLSSFSIEDLLAGLAGDMLPAGFDLQETINETFPEANYFVIGNYIGLEEWAGCELADGEGIYFQYDDVFRLVEFAVGSMLFESELIHQGEVEGFQDLMEATTFKLRMTVLGVVYARYKKALTDGTPPSQGDMQSLADNAMLNLSESVAQMTPTQFNFMLFLAGINDPSGSTGSLLKSLANHGTSVPVTVGPQQPNCEPTYTEPQILMLNCLTNPDNLHYQTVDPSGSLSNHSFLDTEDITSSFGNLVITIVYDFDFNLMFADEWKRFEIAKAAHTWCDLIQDKLSPLTPDPTAGRHLESQIYLPDEIALSTKASLHNMRFCEGQIRIFMGSHKTDESPETSLWARGHSTTPGGNLGWVDLVENRGRAGVPQQAVNVTVGSVSFNRDYNWYTIEQDDEQEQFQHNLESTMLHNIGHLLGFGSSLAWDKQINMNGSGNQSAPKVFEGMASIAVATNLNNEAPLLEVSPGFTPEHWNDSLGLYPTYLWGQPQLPLMTHDIPIGTRKELTHLDIAAMKDLGWTLTLGPGVSGFLELLQALTLKMDDWSKHLWNNGSGPIWVGGSPPPNGDGSQWYYNETIYCGYPAYWAPYFVPTSPGGGALRYMGVAKVGNDIHYFKVLTNLSHSSPNVAGIPFASYLAGKWSPEGQNIISWLPNGDIQAWQLLNGNCTSSISIPTGTTNHFPNPWLDLPPGYTPPAPQNSAPGGSATPTYNGNTPSGLSIHNQTWINSRLFWLDNPSLDLLDNLTTALISHAFMWEQHIVTNGWAAPYAGGHGLFIGATQEDSTGAKRISTVMIPYYESGNLLMAAININYETGLVSHDRMRLAPIQGTPEYAWPYLNQSLYDWPPSVGWTVHERWWTTGSTTLYQKDEGNGPQVFFPGDNGYVPFPY